MKANSEGNRLSLFAYLLWWEKLDLNQRRPKPTDLQSAPFDHSGILPYVIGGASRNQTWDAQIFSLPLYQLS